MRTWILAALLLPTMASGAPLLAGGITGSPSSAGQALTGVPSFRLGFGERVVPWLSVRMATYTFEESELNATGLEPQLGLRLAFADREAGSVAPIVNVGVYTRYWSLTVEDEEVETDTGKLRPIVGGNLGAGLDAGLTANLSVSVELGVDAFTAGYVFDDDVSHLDVVTTYGAVFANIWL